MNVRLENIIQFLARYALYLVVPGVWLAYVGGVAPWVGGTVGFGSAVLLGTVVLLARRRDRNSPPDRLARLLSQ